VTHVYDRRNLPADGWHYYRKREPTAMIRIDGPFEVATREGVMSCPDGWLAVDANGNPYPIAHDVQQRSYEPIAAEQDVT